MLASPSGNTLFAVCAAKKWEVINVKVFISVGYPIADRSGVHTPRVTCNRPNTTAGMAKDQQLLFIIVLRNPYT